MQLSSIQNKNCIIEIKLFPIINAYIRHVVFYNKSIILDLLKSDYMWMTISFIQVKFNFILTYTYRFRVNYIV
jgi:hypothetical protein